MTRIWTPIEGKHVLRGMTVRLCQLIEVDAAPVPLDMPDSEVLDYLVRLVLAQENEMMSLVKRYNFEESNLRFETCKKALAWLESWQAQPSEEGDK